MTHNEQEQSPEEPRDPVLEEAFGVFVRNFQAPPGFHERVMTRIANARPTLRDRLARWLSPLRQPSLMGGPVAAPSTVFNTQLSSSHQKISRPAGNIDNRDIILRCLYENWPNEVSMISGDSVIQIVDEVLAGNRPEFRIAGGGFNFDLTPYMDTILHATTLLVSMTQQYASIRYTQSSHNTPNAPDECNSPDDRTEENVEELISALARYLTEEKAVGHREATRLARMFIRLNSGGHV